MTVRSLERVFFAAMLVAVFAGFGSSVLAKGRSYGLFIGINKYQGGIPELQGAVNDATNLRQMMISTFGFNAADTKLLLDSDATRKGILDSIGGISKNLKRGDFFLITYSGHGTLSRDILSEQLDEKNKISVDLQFQTERYTLPSDFYDSAICPVDSDAATSGKPWGNIILDDELYDLFTKISAKGVKVVFMSDSCHSGTIARGGESRPRFVAPQVIFRKKDVADIGFGKPKNQRKVETRVFNSSYLALTGAMDQQVSWDLSVSGQPQGLFTAMLLRTVKANGVKAKDMSYDDLMKAVNTAVTRYSRENCDTVQSPQLVRDYGKAETKIFQP